MPNIKISDLPNIALPLDPATTFIEAQTTVAGELVSRRISVTNLLPGIGLDASFVTITANAVLPNERILVGGFGITVTDGGAGNNVTLDFDEAESPVTVTGLWTFNRAAGGVTFGPSTELNFRNVADDSTTFLQALNGSIQWGIAGAGFGVDFMDFGASFIHYRFGAPLFVDEQAAANADQTARGQWWVRDDVPNVPMFTDDTGVDFVLTDVGYFILSATDRVVGTNAGTSQTGDNVFLANALAGDVNIADKVIAIGVNALAAAATLDFEGSIVIGANAGSLIDDTRDPWLIIGNDACRDMPGAGFHDGCTIIGHRALIQNQTVNLQATTILGFEAGGRIDGAASAGGNVFIGFQAVGGGTETSSVTNSVVIGDRAVNSYGPTQIGNLVVIGRFAAQDLSGDDDLVAIGANCLPNASGSDDSVFIGAFCYGSATGSIKSVYIGESCGGANALGGFNVIIGSQALTTPGATGVDHSVMLGFSVGNDIGSETDLFLVESTQGTSSFVNRPYLYGSIINGNLALLSVFDTTTQDENGARLIPTWGSANGVWTMSGAGADLGATADADMLHSWIRNADTALMLQYPSGDTISILHDGSDAIIQENLIIGLPADGKLFINTITGIGPIGNIVSATPADVEIFGAGTATNTVDGGKVELWGGYANNNDGQGGFVRIWGGGAGGGASTGGDVDLIGGEADAAPGDVTLIGGTATVAGAGGSVLIDGGPGFGSNSQGGNVLIEGGTAVGTGVGGDARLLGGGSGPGATGNGGFVRITGGVCNSIDGDGGQVVILSGEGNGTGAGGAISITGGIDSAPNGTGGGAISINAGDGRTGSAGPGGALTVSAGDGAGTGVGGVANFESGSGGFNSSGGALNITAGDSGSNTGGDGGTITIESGAALGTNGDGGDVNLVAGVGNGSGLGGTVALFLDVIKRFEIEVTGRALIFSDTNTNTEVRELAFANQDGTIRALLGHTQASLDFHLTNVIGQGHVILDGFNASAQARTFIDADPDVGVDVFHPASDRVVFRSEADGIALLSTNNNALGSSQDVSLTMFRLDGTTQLCEFGFFGSSNFELRIENQGGSYQIRADDASGTLQRMFLGDPDNVTYIKGDTVGAIRLGVAENSGIECNFGSDVKIFHNNIETARTVTIANGGFEVSSGNGFHPVVSETNFVVRRQDGDIGAVNDATSNPVVDLAHGITVAAGEHCIIEGMLRFESASATPGVRWQVDVSGAALTDSSVAWTLMTDAGASPEGDVVAADVDITHTMGANVEHVYNFRATVSANATLLCGIAFAQDISDGTQTRLLDGSWVKYSIVQ